MGFKLSFDHVNIEADDASVEGFCKTIRSLFGKPDSLTITTGVNLFTDDESPRGIGELASPPATTAAPAPVPAKRRRGK